MTSISEKRGILLMLLSIVFFTVNTLAVRAIALAFPSCDGWLVTAFRGIAGTIIVIALYSRSGQLRLTSLLDRPKVIVRGILGALGVVIFYLTIIKLGAARAVVINLTYPIFAAVFAKLFLKEPLSFRQLAWIISGFVGLVIFLAPKSIQGGTGFYDLLAVIGAITAAAIVVLIRNLHQSEHGSTIFASQAVSCALLALPLTFGTSDPPPLAATSLLLLAGVVVAGGQLAMTFAYRHLEVSKGASLQLLLPIATGIGAWIFFDETFGAIELSGAALTLLATLKVHPRTSKTKAMTLSTQPTKQ